MPTAGQVFDELHGPVPGAEERVGPFEEGDAGAVDVGVDELTGGEERPRRREAAALPSPAPDGEGNAEHIIDHALDGGGLSGLRTQQLDRAGARGGRRRGRSNRLSQRSRVTMRSG